MQGESHGASDGRQLLPPSRFFRVKNKWEQFRALGKKVCFKKNETVIRQGVSLGHCYFVEKGSIAAVTQTESGKELLFGIMEENSMFGEEGMLFGYQLPVAFCAQTDAELIRIEKPVLLEALYRDPDLMMALLETESSKFLAVVMDNQKMKTHNSEWLICDLLQLMAEKDGVNYDQKILIQRKVSINYMSSLLGINRGTMIRGLNNLKNLNLIEVVNGFYCIRDMKLLKQHQDALFYL